MRPLKIKGCDRVAFSPDGTRLACFARFVAVWDLAKRIKTLKSHPLSYPAAVCFSPSGDQLAVKSTSGRIVVVDPEDGGILCDFLNFKDGEGSNILYSPCGEFLIDGTWKGRLLVRRVNSGKIEFVQEFPGEMITRVHSANRGATWIIQHGPKCTSYDSPPPPEYFSIWEWPIQKESFGTFRQASPFVRSSAVTQDGELLALVYGAPPRTLAVYHLAAGKQIAHTSVEIGGTGSTLNWSRDCRYLGSVQRHRVVIYSVDGLLKILEHSLPYASDINFSPQGDLVAFGSWEAGVVLPMDAITTLSPA